MEETTTFSIYPTQFSATDYHFEESIVFWDMAVAWLVLNLTMICVIVILLLLILQTTITVIRRFCVGKQDKALAKQASTAAMKNTNKVGRRIYLPRPSLKNWSRRRSQSFSRDADGIIKKDVVGVGCSNVGVNIVGEDFWEAYLTRDNIPQEYYDDHEDFLELGRNAGNMKLRRLNGVNLQTIKTYDVIP
ncbi:unnamed protein product [Orchesella dallaii]|uniref:Uncharacterized protein n=1 Tax=Orchesella dallaii TaxID=48710 RepID=A0ABP1S4M5_9HEXA